MKKGISAILKLSLVVLFIYYYAGSTSFVHTHIIHNYTITHSHPFLPGAHHEHSGEEAGTISWLNTFIVQLAPLLTVALQLFFLRYIFYFCITAVQAKAPRFFRLRSPPACA